MSGSSVVGRVRGVEDVESDVEGLDPHVGAADHRCGHPGRVVVGENGEVDLIREAEDLTDVERREKLPTRLTAHLADCEVA